MYSKMCGEYFKYFVLLFSIASFCAKASTPEELKQKYAAILVECSKDNAVTAADIEQLKQKVMPDTRSVQCLFACAYKRSGMMDAQGNLSVDGILAVSREVYNDDAASMQNAAKFAETCRSVNDQPVTDGALGCDRAALIFKCTVENAPNFDFVL